jgi:hypothetical protein
MAVPLPTVQAERSRTSFPMAHMRKAPFGGRPDSLKIRRAGIHEKEVSPHESWCGTTRPARALRCAPSGSMRLTGLARSGIRGDQGKADPPLGPSAAKTLPLQVVQGGPDDTREKDRFLDVLALRMTLRPEPGTVAPLPLPVRGPISLR